jgi:hypothetical protein
MGPIPNLFQFYRGLGQDPGEKDGTDELFDRLYRLNCDGLYTAIPFRWKSWVSDDLAYNTRHLAYPDRRHYVGGFSYGGHSAVQYCWEAKRRGEVIDILFLIDAVKRVKGSRWSWLARGASLLPLTHWIPDNVRQVVWWYQRSNRPYGHPVKPYKKQSKTHFPQPDGIEVDIAHENMEDFRPIHEKIARDIERDMKREYN